MKKILFILVVAIATSVTVQAQVNSKAIGVRLGGGTFVGGELSYQHGMGSANRLELDLGWGSNVNHHRLYLIGMYHWNWNIVAGLNWYVGPGAGVGLYTYTNEDAYVGVAVGGQIGIEYDFNSLGAPLLLSVDVRPMWDFLGTGQGFGWGSALGIRYTF